MSPVRPQARLALQQTPLLNWEFFKGCCSGYKMATAYNGHPRPLGAYPEPPSCGSISTFGSTPFSGCPSGVVATGQHDLRRPRPPSTTKPPQPGIAPCQDRRGPSATHLQAPGPRRAPHDLFTAGCCIRLLELLERTSTCTYSHARPRVYTHFRTFGTRLGHINRANENIRPPAYRTPVPSRATLHAPDREEPRPCPASP